MKKYFNKRNLLIGLIIIVIEIICWLLIIIGKKEISFATIRQIELEQIKTIIITILTIIELLLLNVAINKTIKESNKKIKHPKILTAMFVSLVAILFVMGTYNMTSFSQIIIFSLLEETTRAYYIILTSSIIKILYIIYKIFFVEYIERKEETISNEPIKQETQTINKNKISEVKTEYRQEINNLQEYINKDDD